MKINHNDIRSLVKSFSYAFSGLFFCVKNERNMRIHLVATTYVLLVSLFYHLTKEEYALLITAIALVLICEMFNTAIETLTNLASPAYNNLAKIAKDIAAGAVLLAAIFAVVIGFQLFFDMDTLTIVFQFVFLDPLRLCLFIISVIASVIFIFKGFSFTRKPRRTYFNNKGDKH